MDFFWAFLSLLAGIILVAKGGDFFVDAASWMAKAAGIPTFIVGATIVSIATTLPEIIVSCMAAFEGKTEMAIGNAVGSVTVNTAMIMAIAYIFMRVTIVLKDYLFQCILLILSGIVLIIGCYSGSLSVWAAVVLITIFAIHMIVNVRLAKKHSSESKEKEAEIPKDKKTVIVNICKFVGGAAGIVVGSRFLVDGGSDLATLLGVPERIVAVTVVAVGTSIPELVTMITAVKKKEYGLSVGNIVGANIIDLSLILPLCSLISGEKLPVSEQGAHIDMPVCLGVTILAIVPLLIRRKASRVQGILLMIAYVIYLAFTV
ncbi:MAG: calcium/sodium antiporter [Lachnospiraceae bacterium]|nr:calcium/sodium antiporter [Lachnospiraceae bacterium]